MKVLVCGSRGWLDSAAIVRRIDKLPDDTIVIAGGALGADHAAAFYARHRGLFVAEVACTDLHWERFGKRS
jgi:hypothetical protein